MAKHTGKDGVVKAGPTPTAIGHVTGWTINEQIGTTQSRATGQTYVNQYALLRQWNGTVDIELDHADAGQDLLVVGDKIAVEFYSEGDAAGKSYFSGTALITNKDTASPSDGMATVSVQFAGDGALSKATV